MAECEERIERLEQEHNQLGDAEHLRTQRAEVKEKKRKLDQEVQRLHVRVFLFCSPYLHLKHACFGTASLG